MIECKVMDISPVQAASWLQGNNGNRPLSHALVKAYATDMKNGDWALNGETIKISYDADGNVLVVDGQHRLHAIIEANTTIQSVVVIHVEDARFIDNGRGRTFKDSAQLGDNSLEYTWMRCNVIVAVSRIAIKHQQKTEKKATNAQVYKYMIENAKALEYVYSMQNKVMRVKGLLKAAVWAAVKAAYDSGYDIDKLSEFCTVFAHGEGTSKTHTPIIRFRNWCISNSQFSGNVAQKVTYMRCQYALKAFETQNVVAVSKEATKEYYVLK